VGASCTRFYWRIKQNVGEAPDEVEISVSEMVEVFKEIQEHPGKILEMFGRYAKVVGIFE